MIPFINFLDIYEFILLKWRERGKIIVFSLKGACITAHPLSFGGNVKSKYIFTWEPSRDGRCYGSNTQACEREIICLKMKRTKQQSLFSVWQKTIQGWHRPGYICSVTMFLQLYLFDFKMPEFEFIPSFFHSSNIHMLTSINPWLLSFLVPRQWYTTVAEYLIIHVRVLSLKIPSFSKLSAQTCCCYTFQAASIIVHGHWRRFFPANR